jgi:isoquinoline 1-oxidoreductase beta subunit
VSWSPAPADAFNSADGLKEFLARATNRDDAGLSYLAQGDADATFARAAKVITGQYSSEYLYHAQMEPLNVTASVSNSGDAAEIWIGTQGVSINVAAAAAILNTTQDRIKLNQFYLGGGFGRRTPADLLPEALRLAKAMKQPVKLIWMREQDVKSCEMRPMTGHLVEAALDSEGNVIGWRHRLVAESPVARRFGEGFLARNKGLDVIALDGAKHEYEIPNQSIVYLREKRGMPVAPWRAVGSGHNKFVIETFIDELAATQKKDPVAFRLGLLKGVPRAQAVISAVVDKSGWGKPVADGHALGFCYAQVVETYVAAVGDISLDRKSRVVRAHRFWLVLDPGIVVNPDSVLAQTEGNVIFGLSQTLKEQLSISAGKVKQTNFHDYPVLRMSEMPEIDIQLLSTDNPPKGVGEAALPLVAPCVANALFKLTGKRSRALPLSPERILETQHLG